MTADPEEALARLADALPQGLTAHSAEEVGVSSPSLQSLLRWAEYDVEIPHGELSSAGVQQAIARVLQSDSLPSEYRREKKVRSYDLRPLLLGLRLEREESDCFVLSMRLSAEQDKTARVDQVVMALELPAPRRIHRRRLYLDEIPAAVLAYRRTGEWVAE